jgi:hypothetical protein
MQLVTLLSGVEVRINVLAVTNAAVVSDRPGRTGVLG